MLACWKCPGHLAIGDFPGPEASPLGGGHEGKARRMTLFSRYVFRQVANAFLIILLTLTAIVWLATALRQLDLIISQGQGVVLFLKLTLLSLPSLMALIAPNAMLMAALYTLDRLNGDSELIVMTASGATIWRIGSSLIVLGVPRLRRDPPGEHLRDPGKCAPPAQFRHPGQDRPDLASPSTRPIFQPQRRPHLPYPRPNPERRSARPLGA